MKTKMLAALANWATQHDVCLDFVDSRYTAEIEFNVTLTSAVFEELSAMCAVHKLVYIVTPCAGFITIRIERIDGSQF